MLQRSIRRRPPSMWSVSLAHLAQRTAFPAWRSLSPSRVRVPAVVIRPDCISAASRAVT